MLLLFILIIFVNPHSIAYLLLFSNLYLFLSRYSKFLGFTVINCFDISLVSSLFPSSLLIPLAMIASFHFLLLFDSFKHFIISSVMFCTFRLLLLFSLAYSYFPPYFLSYIDNNCLLSVPSQNMCS